MNPATILPDWLRGRIERSVALGILHSPRATEWVGRRRRTTLDGRTLDRQFAALIEMDEFTGPAEVSQMSVGQARANIKHSTALVDATPPSDGEVRRIQVRGADGMLAARLYVPEGLPAGSPLIVNYHGGGWVTLDLDTHESFCRYVAKRSKVRVISVDYRLAPEAKFPSAARDATAAFFDIAARANEFGADAKRLAVMGDSAGGNLATVVAQQTRSGTAQPALQVLLYPALDATFQFQSHKTFAKGFLLTQGAIDWYLANYAPPEIDRRNPELSPYFGDVSGIAPALIYTAGFDPLRDEAEAYSKELSVAGVSCVYREFTSLCHGFALMRSAVDAASAAAQEIADAIGERLSG